MQNFFLEDRVSYSLEQEAQLIRDSGTLSQDLEAFLNLRLRGPEADLEEVIVVGTALGEEVPYAHAITILSHPKDSNLIISDSAADTLACWPAKPPGYGDKPLFKLGDITDQYVILTIFRVKREVIAERHQEHLKRELRYIMTGEEQTEEIKEKQ